MVVVVAKTVKKSCDKAHSGTSIVVDSKCSDLQKMQIVIPYGTSIPYGISIAYGGKNGRIMYSWKSDGNGAHACNCIGPQRGQPLCPCMMRDVTVKDGRYVRVQDLGPVSNVPEKSAFKSINDYGFGTQ